ncbi:MAG: alpha/beta hydrolase [Pacificimonas sp.]
MTTDSAPHHFAARDGTQLAYHELGPADGRPLLLIHGLFSNSQVNWMRFGTAKRLAGAGHRCLMLDLRAHGDSDAPTDAEKWPDNILAKDVLDWIAHLGVDDYDLAGFSLGARTSLLAVIEGATPRRLAICGMGLKGIVDQFAGTKWFMDVVSNRDTHAKGTDEYFAVQFMKTNKVDPAAALHLLAAQMDADPNAIANIDIETMVLCATDDRYFEEAKRLHDLLPNSRFEDMPGTHMSCVSKPEFGEALAEFFSP